MRATRRWVGAALATGLLVAPWGCGTGGGTPVTSSTAEAKVHGTVKARDKLVTEGEVIFDPGNAARDVPTRSAPIRKDGTYEVTTLVGRNRVRIAGPPVEKDPQLGYAALTYEVGSGDNSFDIALPPK